MRKDHFSVLVADEGDSHRQRIVNYFTELGWRVVVAEDDWLIKDAFLDARPTFAVIEPNLPGRGGMRRSRRSGTWPTRSSAGSSPPPTAPERCGTAPSSRAQQPSSRGRPQRVRCIPP
jgi:hypothetical protein